MNTKNYLSSGLEDYLETIYLAESDNKKFKGVELARQLNISRASVSEALFKLVQKGLIEYEPHGYILLTERGRNEAEKVYNKHSILTNFFIKVLNIKSNIAEDNACKIEHIISEEIIEKMKNYISDQNI